MILVLAWHHYYSCATTSPKRSYFARLNFQERVEKYSFPYCYVFGSAVQPSLPLAYEQLSELDADLCNVVAQATARVAHGMEASDQYLRQ